MTQTEDLYAVIRQLELATAAHDLRNRLSIAQCQVRQLRCQLHMLTGDTSVLNRLASITRCLARANTLLEELLQTTADELRVPPAKECADDIVCLARQLIEKPPYTGCDHQVWLETRLPCLTGAWDAQRLMLAIRILLDNAIRYSPKAGCVAIEIDANDEWATVVVRDRGPCIPTEDLPHVFEPFFRDQDVISSSSGLGLGLPTARLIVEQYAGTLEVASDESEGNTFTVRLPLVCA